MTQARESDNRQRSGTRSLDLPDGLTTRDLSGIYSEMVRVRTLDERVWALNRQGKAAIVASCQGHEAAQLAAVWSLRANTPDFFCFPYFRDLGVTTALGLTPLQSILGFMAKQGEPMSGARQFPQHGAMPELLFINHSAVIGTQAPQAVGFALSRRMTGRNTVVACFFGDGGSSQGEVHEAMNFASIHRLPVIFLIENNGYAISTTSRQQMAIEHVAQRAGAYAMFGTTVDGTDVVASYRAISEAVLHAAAGGGPAIVELSVERQMPHTSDDDDTMYRSRAEVEKARLRDPLKKLRELLMNAGLLDDAEDARIRESARREIDEATNEAEAAPYPDDGDVLAHVYSEV